MEDDKIDHGRRRLSGFAGVGTIAGAAGLAGGIAIGASGQPPALPRIEAAKRFKGMGVAITGATSGIGRAAAEAFAREGAAVVFCGRRQDLGERVASGIRATGGDAIYVPADVRKPDQVNAFMDVAIRHCGQVDIALNNAGISFSKPLHEITPDEWDQLDRTNVRGVLYAMQAQLRHMLPRKSGQIIVTSSVNIDGVRPGLSAYSASKRALAAMVQTAALEYAPQGVRVNAICPGTTDTAMVRDIAGMQNIPDSAWNIAIAQWARGNAHGMGRIAQPSEIANAILAMAAPDMTYLNGALFTVDGGMSVAL